MTNIIFYRQSTTIFYKQKSNPHWLAGVGQGMSTGCTLNYWLCCELWLTDSQVSPSTTFTLCVNVHHETRTRTNSYIGPIVHPPLLRTPRLNLFLFALLVLFGTQMLGPSCWYYFLLYYFTNLIDWFVNLTVKQYLFVFFCLLLMWACLHSLVFIFICC